MTNRHASSLFQCFGLVLFLTSLALGQQRYAMVIGINDYPKTGFGKLKYAESDAEALAKLLRDQNFSVAEVIGKGATKSRIESELRSFYATLKTLKPNDTSLLFLAGHGLVVHKEIAAVKGKPKSVETSYFCPVDTDGQDEKTLLDIDALISGINDSGAENNLLLIDTCRNSRKQGIAELGEGSLERLPSKISVLYASKNGQKSYESEPLHHGVFTHFILEGLRGEAADKDGRIRIQGLTDFVTSEVNKNSGRLSIRDTDSINTDNQSQIPKAFSTSKTNPVVGEKLDKPLPFNKALKSIADEIVEWLDSESNNSPTPKLSKAKLRLGRFISETNADINFEYGIVDFFRSQLKDILVPSGDLTAKVVKGTYELMAITPQAGPTRPILRITIEIVDPDNQDKKDNKIITRDVDQPSDIARVIGASVFSPANETNTTKALDLMEAYRFPEVGIRKNSKYEIVHTENDKVSVEIRKRKVAENKAPAPVELSRSQDLPFIDLSKGETFDLILRNYDQINPMLAKVYIDGLDVINTFNEDPQPYQGYFLQKATEEGPLAVGIPGWLRTTTRNDKNVFRFSTESLGEGAASERKSLSTIGVITIEFYEPFDPSRGTESDDQKVEIGKGEAIDVEMTTEPFVAQPTPVITISLRYNSASK
ncbi:MAG: hypothetical protein RLY14_192 [Planctomycetota bacterium]|jgi:hypothetical protein